MQVFAIFAVVAMMKFSRNAHLGSTCRVPSDTEPFFDAGFIVRLSIELIGKAGEIIFRCPFGACCPRDTLPACGGKQGL